MIDARVLGHIGQRLDPGTRQGTEDRLGDRHAGRERRVPPGFPASAPTSATSTPRPSWRPRSSSPRSTSGRSAIAASERQEASWS